jgi:hypothetical protein
MYSTLFLSVVASLHGRELDLLLDLHKQILFFLSKTEFPHARDTSWTDRMKNRRVLLRVKEERDILHAVKQREANWIGHILRRNCLLKHVSEGNEEGRIGEIGRGGRRRKQLLDVLAQARHYWMFLCKREDAGN